MQTRVLNYRIIVSPDEETGSGKPGFTAFCPTLGVADDGDTVEEALQNINGAIDAYVESLIEDGESVPVDSPQSDLITTTQVETKYQFHPISAHEFLAADKAR